MLCEKTVIGLDYAGYGLEAPKEPAVLTSYVLDRPTDVYLAPRRAAVVICPGGGYGMVYPGEGEPIAMAFAARGIHAFVLNYSVAPMRFPGALLELSKAVAFVREHAEEWLIDPDRIAVCGFSAGGHLAASLGVYWKEGFVQRYMGFDRDENRPNGLVLGYPVISGAKGITHEGSLLNLMGDAPGEREVDLFSLENHVSDFTPPAFLWHTCDDSCVPVTNSMLFAQALQRAGKRFEYHVFPHGPHGLCLANEVTASCPELVVPECQCWIDMAARFVEAL